MVEIRKVNPKLILLLVCIPNFLYHYSQNGAVVTAVSTIQNQYNLQGSDVGIITGLEDAAQCFALVLLIIIGEQASKGKWIGGGTIVIGMGGAMFSLPYFISPPYEYNPEKINNFCGNVTKPDCQAIPEKSYSYIFMAATWLIGMGAAVLYVYGVTLIDENSTQTESSMYTAIFYFMMAIGPALGFFTEGAMLEMFVDVSRKVTDITSSSPLWIGAWWPAILGCGILLFVSSIPLFFLPKTIPVTGTENFEEDNKNELQRTSIDIEENKKSHKIQSFVSICKNPIFLLSTAILALGQMFIVGSNTFGVKYVESQYGMTPFYSSLAYGLTAVVSVCTGHILAGVIVSKFDLQVKGIIKFCIIFSILSLICTFGFFFYCDDQDFAGGTVRYTEEDSTLSIVSSCNENCGCSLDLFNPVRGSDSKLYYSPCYAGCQYENETSGIYENCTCIANTNSILNHTSNASFYGIANQVDSLNENFCVNIIPFCILTALAFFSSVIVIAPNLQITLRCVEFEHRHAAISFQQIFGHAFGNVPGRLISGKLMDLACVVWSTECDQTASCKIYKRWELAFNFFILLLGEAFIILVLFIIMYFLHVKALKKLPKQNKTNNKNIIENVHVSNI